MMMRSFAFVLLLATANAFAPQPKVTIVSPIKSTVGGWEKDYYSTVNVDPSQLDAAFLSANGAALESKITAVSKVAGMSAADTKSKLLDLVGEFGILGTDADALAKKLKPSE